MKLTKKLLSMLIALTMVFTLAIPAFAANDGSIKITNAKKDYTYTAYKILDLESYKPGDETTGVVEEYLYKVADGWTDFFAQASVSKYFTVDASGYVKWNDAEEKEAGAAEIAKLAMEYVNTKKLTSDHSVKPTADGEATITGLDLGYYLVDTTMGALCSLGTTDTVAEITEKNAVPEIKKEVQEDSKVDEEGKGWGETNDADIGQTVNFKATVTVQKGAENYTVHDTMSAGLTYDGVTSVTVNGIDVEEDNYTVTAPGTDNCTFEVAFDNEYIAGLEADTEIVIEYSAVLNENAEIAGEGNPNEVKLQYGDNNTVEATTITYAYKFDLVKVGTDKKKLDGATFKLYDAETAGNVIELVEESAGVYRPALDNETPVEVITAGDVVIKGLDGGTTYYLEEITAPQGYNKLTARVPVELESANIEKSVADDVYDGGILVVNKSGTELPSTGGIGTTLFYLGGGAMFLGALVVLVTKKRMKD